jgi:hypothetical protein
MSANYYLDQIKKCVVFIFECNEEIVQPLGTAFFVNVKKENTGIAYLVTAKHVLLDDSGKLYERIRIRLNNRKGSSDQLQLNLSELNIRFHSDENVDLAAIQVGPDPRLFDYLLLPEAYFTTPTILREKNIREGSTAFFAGLFVHYYGKQRNYPVIRFGKIALISEEKIEVYEKGYLKTADLYIVECQSMGAFSGSPVFFELDRITKDGRFFSSPEIYLGGVMKGHYNNIVDLVPGMSRELNAGLALITPCYLLTEILHSTKE